MGSIIDVVPDFIPLLFKIPIKGLVAPVHLRFRYTKYDSPHFDSLSSTLQVYLSETELEPHRIYQMKNAPPEEQAKFSKAQLRKLREVNKLVVYKNCPKEIIFNPQVSASKGPGYV